MWKDRNGDPVRFVSRTESGNGDWYVMDAKGFVWATNYYDGVPRPFITYGIVYASTNCTGAGFISTRLQSRFVFTTAGDPTYRVMPDAPVGMVTNFAVGSGFGPGGCSASPYVADVVPLAETVPTPAIVAPATLFTPPVHPAAF